MQHEIDDVRIQNIRPLMAPDILLEDLPVRDAQSETIFSGRREIERIMSREDDRLVVIVGPCSIHDPEAGLEYARRLATIRDQYRDALCIVMEWAAGGDLGSLIAQRKRAGRPFADRIKPTSYGPSGRYFVLTGTPRKHVPRKVAAV